MKQLIPSSPPDRNAVSIQRLLWEKESPLTLSCHGRRVTVGCSSHGAQVVDTTAVEVVMQVELYSVQIFNSSTFVQIVVQVGTSITVDSVQVSYWVTGT
jgi:hypothetical protein